MKVPKRGQFHAAIHVTPKTLRFVPKDQGKTEGQQLKGKIVS